MENNELMNEVTEVTEVEVYDMEPEVSGGNLGKVVLGVGIATGIGVAIYKFRGKINEKITEQKIKKLEKQGYVVTKPTFTVVPNNVEEFEGDVVADEE